MGQNINRRAALFGAAISTAALAAPAVAKVTERDHIARFLETATADELVQYHAKQLAKALCKARPGLWRFTTASIHSDQCAGNLLFHRQEANGHSGFAQDF